MFASILQLSKRGTEEFRMALSDLLDGNSRWSDIQHFTGLPEERCRKIEAVYGRIAEEEA